jgi:hypothetical protein
MDFQVNLQDPERLNLQDPERIVPRLNQKINANHAPEIAFDWMKNKQETVPSETELLRNTLLPVKDDPNYEQIRKVVLPYTQLKSRFQYLDSLKLAEIDSIFKVCPRSPLSPYFPSLLAYTSSILVNAVDIGGGPGAYTEYYQFRYVNSMTLGFTKRHSENELDPAPYGWNLKVLDPHRLIRFYGNDYSGDLLGQFKDFLLYADQQFMNGAEFVIATTPTYKHQDFYAALQLYLIIRTIKDGASAVLRLHGTWSHFMYQVVYFATQTFEQVHLFQPLVSGSDSDEIFLVLEQARYNRKDYYLALQNLFKSIPTDLNIVDGFIANPLPNDFLKQMLEIKNRFVEMQSATLLEMQKYLRDGEIGPRKKIDIVKKLLEWSLPDPYE